MAGEAASPMTHHHAFEFIRQQIAEEFALINGRVASFAACQAFLITAFTLSLGNSAVYRAGWLGQFLLPSLGVLLCMAVIPGLRGAGRTIDEWRRLQHELLASPDAIEELRPIAIGRFVAAPDADRLHRHSLWFSNLLPAIMLLFWLMCFVLERIAPVIHDA